MVEGKGSGVRNVVPVAADQKSAQLPGGFLEPSVHQRHRAVSLNNLGHSQKCQHLPLAPHTVLPTSPERDALLPSLIAVL